MPEMRRGIDLVGTSQRQAEGQPLVKALLALGHGINTAIGGTYALAKTRSLPKLDEKGNLVFTGDENQTPVTLGDVMVLPPGTTERTRIHEQRHADQSRALGLQQLLMPRDISEEDALSHEPSYGGNIDISGTNWLKYPRAQVDQQTDQNLTNDALAAIDERRKKSPLLQAIAEYYSK